MRLDSGAQPHFALRLVIAAMAPPGISRVFQVHDWNQLVHDLRQVRQLIACGAPLTTESRLVAGQAVRVRRGLLAGMEGIVLARRRVTRLVVSIDPLD